MGVFTELNEKQARHKWIFPLKWCEEAVCVKCGALLWSAGNDDKKHKKHKKITYALCEACGANLPRSKLVLDSAEVQNDI